MTTTNGTSGCTARREQRPLPGLARPALSRVAMELRVFFREKDQVLFTFAYPVIMLAIFGSVFSQDIAPGLSFSQYFLAGMVATGIMLVSFQSLAITIAMERDDGTLKRLVGTPMPRAAYFLGKVGMVLVVGGVQVAVLLVVGATLFDVTLPGEVGPWVTFGWVALLGLAAGTLSGIAFSSVPRSGKSASAVVTPVVLVLQFASGIFFVYSELPEWMRSIAALFPLKWMAQGMRSVFLPESSAAREVTGSWQHGATALVLIAWTLGALVLCLRTFRWQRRDDA